MLNILTNQPSTDIILWKLSLISVSELSSLETSLKDILGLVKFTGKFGQVSILAERKEIFVGLTFQPEQKTADPYHVFNFYQLGAKIVRSIAPFKIENLELQNHSIFLESKHNNFGEFSKYLLDLLLGISQASWNLDTYLPESEAKSRNINLSFGSSLSNLLTPDLVSTFNALNNGVTLTRSLVDDIPENINPTTLPKLVEKELGHKANITLKVIDYSKIVEMGMEGIYFVGRASIHDPVMVHVVLSPKGEVKNRVCLVGKGVTYDSGGLDIKTAGSMKTMKVDMAGSATMFGVMKVLSEMELENTEVHWISAWVENMVAGNSYKTDDVLTTYSGQTVEIWNTDAEGRLTLADALAYATLQNPDYIIDAATLTGAAVRSVSEYYTAMMSNDFNLVHGLEKTFIQEGEKTTHTPLPEVLRSKVKGDVGQLLNVSTIGAYAGHLTAGLFLSYFVDQKNFRNPKLDIKEPKAYAWAHLDIAGSCWNKKQNDLEANGATGQSVRSLAAWVIGLDGK